MRKLIVPPKTSWVIITYDGAEYSLSEREYEVFKRASAESEIKFIHLPGLSLAIGDIRRVEKRTKEESFTYDWGDE